MSSDHRSSLITQSQAGKMYLSVKCEDFFISTVETIFKNCHFLCGIFGMVYDIYVASLHDSYKSFKTQTKIPNVAYFIIVIQTFANDALIR